MLKIDLIPSKSMIFINEIPYTSPTIEHTIELIRSMSSGQVIAINKNFGIGAYALGNKLKTLGISVSYYKEC